MRYLFLLFYEVIIESVNMIHLQTYLLLLNKSNIFLDFILFSKPCRNHTTVSLFMFTFLENDASLYLYRHLIQCILICFKLYISEAQSRDPGIPN